MDENRMSLPSKEKAESILASVDGSLYGSKVLIVEDDEMARRILERRLTKCGYNVEVAEDGEQGWQKVHDFRPDVVLSDWMMPGMDGTELCSKIKSDPDFATIFFILLTAKDSNEDKVIALDTGADEYLVKPCEANELMARVRAAERVVTLQRNLAEKNTALQAAMKRINGELEVMSKIQRALLPGKLLTVPGYKFASYYRPSTECSGDYYDLIQLPGDRFAMIIADVSGHGTPAMVAMALVRSLVHLFAQSATSAAFMLGTVNRILFEQLPTRQFVTSFYAVCDATTGAVQYSSAGHNPPLLLDRTTGQARFLEHCEGFPLKLVTPDAQYENHDFTLAPGQALLMYTDGIPEGCNANLEQFDNERMSQAALAGVKDSPEGVLEAIMKSLITYTDGCPLHDDVSMLLVSRND